MEPAEVVNRTLEKLETAQARLPNGENMDLYSIRQGVLLYGTSLEGDDYIRGPLFYSPGDALLHALNPAYLRDTVGAATAENPANSSSSARFHFATMLRLREYRFDSSAFFYDSRKRIRPVCLDVGVSNFKTHFYLRLPLGNDRNQQPLRPVQGTDQDLILENIVNGKTTHDVIRSEAFHFCQPGRTLRIDKSFRISTSVLWTFYVGLLSKGYTPSAIRVEAFLGEKSKGLLGYLLSDEQKPTMIGDLPGKISEAIRNKAGLEDLARECSKTPLGQKTCVSGVFFKSLWDRDLKSILEVYSPSAFLAADKQYFYPFPFVAGNRPTPKAGRGYRPPDPYISTWFYKEDLLEDMGRDVLAYNWNYNRFLDVNTVLYWVLFNLQETPPTQPYQKPVRSPFLVKSAAYDPQRHLSLLQHRFSAERLAKVRRISIYDSARETILSLTFDPREEAPSLTVTRGLYLTVKSVHKGLADPDRGTVVQNAVLEFIQSLPGSMGDILPIVGGARDALGKVDPQLRILSFLPSNQTLEGIPTNWLVLPLVSSLLRYLIRNWEFEFFLFE